MPDGAGDAYDWIGFDPRGVGSSVPALSCIPDYAGYNRPDYQPEGGQEAAAWLERSKAYAKACAANGGELLDHLTTVDTVTDMDSIRKALGAEQINWYGFSYGTYIGQVYAHPVPENVRRMVLDGIVDPRDVWYEANLNQDVAFERDIGEFFDWVAKFDSVYGLGATGDEVEALYYATQDELRVDAGRPDRPRRSGTTCSCGAGYNVLAWPGVADAFAAWVKDKDAAALKDAYDGSTDDDRRQRLRDLPGRPVHRRAVAEGLGRLARRQHPGRRRRRRSRPGPTPGSTRRARSGRRRRGEPVDDRRLAAWTACCSSARPSTARRRTTGRCTPASCSRTRR